MVWLHQDRLHYTFQWSDIYYSRGISISPNSSESDSMIVVSDKRGCDKTRRARGHGGDASQKNFDKMVVLFTNSRYTKKVLWKQDIK